MQLLFRERPDIVRVLSQCESDFFERYKGSRHSPEELGEAVMQGMFALVELRGIAEELGIPLTTETEYEAFCAMAERFLTPICRS